MHRRAVLLLCSCPSWLLVTACSSGPEGQSPPAAAVPAPPPFRAPPTRTVPQVDTIAGQTVADPYRWLEDQDGAEVATWVAAQNAATAAWLGAIPERPALRRRLQELWNQPRHGLPVHAGDRWLHSHNDGLQDQSVYYLADTPTGAGKVLLDPNTLSKDGTVALAAVEADEAGDHLAYATSARGSDWRTWHVLDLRSGTTLPDTLEWSKFGGAAWSHDGQGFFYVRYPTPQPGQEYQAATTNPQLCYHRLGKAQADDVVVYERPDQPKWGFGARVSDDGRFLLIAIGAGTDVRNRVAYVDLQADGWQVQPLRMELEAGWRFLGNDGDQFYFVTDHDAERRRIVALDRTQPSLAPRPLVAQQPATLTQAELFGDRFVCHYLVDAASELRVHRLDGTLERVLQLPYLGTVAGMSGRRRDAGFHFGFSAPLQPPSVLHCELAGGTLQTVRAPRLAFDFASYQTERRFLQSPDGTRLCLFVTHRKGLVFDGRHRALLYGYGGFDIATTPTFSIPTLVWLEQGGIAATAVLRGGGEYGQQWHRAGMLDRKQNVFDDFVACADFLVRNGYTTHDRLAIHGGSNGGLLVGACLVQHPGKFGAAIPEVGVLDMLRYHRFTIGHAWAPEYGTADDPTQFAWLRAYSPLHNIVPGTAYPPTLVMTGDHDDRVLPGHSYKFAATLQAAQQGPGPILLRVGTNAGHGGGKPVGKQIEEATDRLAFLLRVLPGPAFSTAGPASPAGTPAPPPAPPAAGSSARTPN